MQYDIVLVPLQMQSTEHIHTGYDYTLKFSFGPANRIFKPAPITTQGSAAFTDKANDYPSLSLDLVRHNTVSVTLFGVKSRSSDDQRIIAQGAIDLIRLGCNVTKNESQALEKEVILKGAAVAGPLLLDYAIIMFPTGSRRPAFSGLRGAPLEAEPSPSPHQRRPTTRAQTHGGSGGRGSVARGAEANAELGMILDEIMVKEEQLTRIRTASTEVPALRAQLEKKKQILARLEKEESESHMTAEDQQVHDRLPKLKEEAMKLRAMMIAAERSAADSGVDTTAVLKRFDMVPLATRGPSSPSGKRMAKKPTTNVTLQASAEEEPQSLRELRADLDGINRQMAQLEKEQATRDVTEEACQLMEAQSMMEGLIKEAEKEHQESVRRAGFQGLARSASQGRSEECAPQRNLLRSRVEKLRLQHALAVMNAIGTASAPPALPPNDESAIRSVLDGIKTIDVTATAAASASPAPIQGKVVTAPPPGSKNVVQGTINARHLPPPAQPVQQQRQPGNMDDLFGA